MKVTERDLKAVGRVDYNDLLEAAEFFQRLCNKYENGHFAAAALYHLGRIHGIQQERARRHKKSPVTDQSKQG